MIVGLVHVGISVANLERSIEFYRSGLGMEVRGQGTFERGAYGGKYEAVLGLPGATGRVVTLKGNQLELELFEFSYPSPQRSDPRRPVCDHGITHFCIQVTDIEGEYQRLKAAGATFHCPPQEFPGEAIVTYGRDPDGNVFELLQLIPKQ